MLHILRKARTTTRTIYPWSNPAIIFQQLSSILSSYGTGFKVEFAFSLSTSSSPSPPNQIENSDSTTKESLSSSKQQNTAAPTNLTKLPLSIKKERNAAFQDFKRSLVRGRPSAAAAALDAYHIAGGPPSRPMIHSLMDLYSRKGDADSVVNLLNTMIESSNPPPNQHSFGYAISALKISAGAASTGTAGTDMTKQSARHIAATRALHLFEIMVSPKVNLAPNSTLYNELIDCFGKAGDVDQVFNLFQRAVKIDKITPTVHTFSILIKACAIAKQPDRANDVVFKLMPQHGVIPGIAAWNNLLGAAAAAAGGSVDRAYDVWQKMIDAGVVPDMHTERGLAKAFATHPQLAAELVREARTLAEEKKEKENKKHKFLEMNKKNDKKKGGMENGKDASDDVAALFSSASGRKSARNRNKNLQAPTTLSATAAASPPVFASAPSKQQPIFLDDLQRKKQNLSAYALGLAPDLASSFFGKESKNGVRQQQERSEEQEEEKELRDYNNDDDGVLLIETSTDSTSSAIELSNLLTLDLHGHSQAAAEMTLLCRLEALVEHWPKIVKQQAQHAQQNDTEITPPPLPDHLGLVIITGMGKGSRDGMGVLKHAVRAVLNTQGLSAHDVPNNSGRLFVPWVEITHFAEKQWERMQKEHFYAAARARYATVGVGVAGVVAAAVIIPRLGPWLI